MDDTPESRRTTAGRAKARYHHGDLRETLIAASYDLVAERGAENFLLSEACKLAGVSTAAPYKHFKDRHEILEEVAARGFDELSERSAAAVEANGPGTLEGIIAMGEAYVQFAIDNQHLFRLMFGQRQSVKSAEEVQEDGAACFAGVIGAVAHYCAANSVPGDPGAIAIRLWTFVHGAASLLIDEDYAVVAPGLDVFAMIRETTPGLLAPVR